jgi:hypothetical protein
LLFEHFLAKSKTHLSWVHMGWEYFLRINGAAKWGKVCALEKSVLICISPGFWQCSNIWVCNTPTDWAFLLWK